MFSTFSNPNPKPYRKMNFNGKRTGVSLPNNKAGWLDNICKNKCQNPVYWATKGLVGINTAKGKEQVVPIGTPIAVKGSVSVNGVNKSVILYGTVKEIIIPDTNVQDLCQNNNYTNAELGLLPNQNAVNVISQSLNNPTIVLGYEINVKDRIILDFDGEVSTDMIDRIIDKNVSDSLFSDFLKEVVRKPLNQKGVYIEF